MNCVLEDVITILEDLRGVPVGLAFIFLMLLMALLLIFRELLRYLVLIFRDLEKLVIDMIKLINCILTPQALQLIGILLVLPVYVKVLCVIRIWYGSLKALETSLGRNFGWIQYCESFVRLHDLDWNVSGTAAGMYAMFRGWEAAAIAIATDSIENPWTARLVEYFFLVLDAASVLELSLAAGDVLRMDARSEPEDFGSVCESMLAHIAFGCVGIWLLRKYT